MTGEGSALGSIAIEAFASSEAGARSNAYLISDASDAILFDAPMLRGDAEKLAGAILSSGKRLTTVFISHAHPDHFLASDVIAERFPSARFVSTANVAADLRTDCPRILSMVQDRLGPEAPARLVTPQPMSSSSLKLGGRTLEVVEFGECEAKHVAALYIPELKTLIAADVVYHNAHLYLQERRIEGWLQRLDELEAFARGRIETLCPGHGGQAGLEIIDETRGYLREFAKAAASGGAAELERRMLAKYPTYRVKQFLTAFSIPAYFPSKLAN